MQEAAALAVNRSMEFLRMKIDPDRKDYLKLISLQQTTASAVLSLFGRVNGAALKGRRGDKMGELLARIKAAKQTMN